MLWICPCIPQVQFSLITAPELLTHFTLHHCEPQPFLLVKSTWCPATTTTCFATSHPTTCRAFHLFLSSFLAPPFYSFNQPISSLGFKSGAPSLWPQNRVNDQVSKTLDSFPASSERCKEIIALSALNNNLNCNVVDLFLDALASLRPVLCLSLIISDY